MENDPEDLEEMTYFVGPCTCEHAPGQHSWGNCGVDGCECQAGWEE